VKKFAGYTKNLHYYRNGNMQNKCTLTGFKSYGDFFSGAGRV